jgi:hypothetical protein
MQEMTVLDLEHYAIRRLGLVTQSVDKLRPMLPRWRRRLEGLGFDEVPRFPYDGWTPWRVAQFDNLMALWLKQAAKNDPSGAHGLRNLTGTRQFKA